MYDSFYFLHIPKTCGRYINASILHPNRENIKGYVYKYEHVGHLGWVKDINANTYVFTILRNPIEWVCSWYYHFGGGDDNSLTWFLDTNEDLYNAQSKYILLTDSDPHKLKNKFINYKTIDEDLLYEKLNRINSIMTKDFIENNDLEIVEKNIFKDLPISEVKIINNNNKYENIKSKHLYDNLDDKMKERIINLFNIDYKIYSQLKYLEDNNLPIVFDKNWKLDNLG